MNYDADLTVETDLWQQHPLVCSMDEVGRGCLAGPVTVGAVVLQQSTKHLSGLRDSKVLSEKRRHTLVPLIDQWATAHAVGSASAKEIDTHGIMHALHLAGQRALQNLAITPNIIILDGNVDYLTDPDDPFDTTPHVRTMIKADMTVASCAAASIIAKTHRDQHMIDLHAQDNRWAWERNKGYGSPAHLTALSKHRPTEQHRKTFLTRIKTAI